MKPKLKEIIYKRHQILDLYCPNCNKFLSGNGSVMSPYTCQCGEWERDWETLDYYLSKKNEKL